MGTLRYRYPNQNWVEVPADAYSFSTEGRVQQVPTGRVLYGIYGLWASNSWFPNRVDLLSDYRSWCPPVLSLRPNGKPINGIQHNYAYISACPLRPEVTVPNANDPGLLSNFGSWVAVWIGYEIPETVQQYQTRCNILVTNNGVISVIEGVWLQGCPEVQFISGSCPAGSIDCGGCCLPCDSLVGKIRALI